MSWLDNYSTTNTFRSMYINGFMDISGGRLQTRSVTDGHLFIAGDTSLNGNLYVGGDISWNPNSLANDSIPSSAIIGGAVGATGPAGPGGSSTEVMCLTAVQTGTDYTATVNNIDNWYVYGTADMLSEARVLRAQAGNWSMMALNFKSGVYRVSINLRWSGSDQFFYGFDIDQSENVDTSNPVERFFPLVTDSGENQVTSRIFFVSCQCNFHFYGFDSAGAKLAVYRSGSPQLTFERIGDINLTSSVAQSLSVPNGSTQIESSDIYGGIHFANAPADHIPYNSVLNSPTYTIPPIMVGTTHSSHNPSSSGWVHAIDTTSTSSVEVASFHSDADLSLNKRLFVGEDVSLNGNLYVGGDISWNPTSLANDSIPSSAIIKEYMLLDAVATNGNQGIYDMNWNIYGNQNLLADNRAFRCSGNAIQGTSAHAVSLLFNPGIYRVTCTFCMAVRQAFSFAFDTNDDGYFSYNGAYSTSHHVTDLEPLNVSRSTTTTNEQETVVYMFVVPHVSNFHIQTRTGNSSLETSFVNYSGQHPQFMFERMGEIATSGTNSVLSHPGFYSNTIGNQDSFTITDGIYW